MKGNQSPADDSFGILTKHLALIGGFMLVAVTSLGITTASAAGGIDGTGTGGTCPLAGKVGIKPPIMGFPNPDTSPPATIKLSAKTPKGATCSGGTGDGAHVISGGGKGTGTTPHSSCSGLLGMTADDITLIIKWKTNDKTLKLNPSTVHITNVTGGATMDGHGSFMATGTITAGSFNGNTVSASIQTDQTTADLATACTGKGIKKITFSINTTLTLS